MPRWPLVVALALWSLAGCRSAWSQPATPRPRPDGASHHDAAPACRFPLVAIDRDDHCGRFGQRWVNGAAAGAVTSCQPGEAMRADGLGCDPRGGGDRPDDAGVTSRWETPNAAQRARVPATMSLLPGATWRTGGRWTSVGALALDRTEVTVGAWRRCVAAGMCTGLMDPLGAMTRDAMPVVNVTHAQAERYCAFAGSRLPTDAEWSLAARGVECRRSPWGTRAADCTLARTSGCGDGAVAAGSTAAGASPQGVLDLVGNVAEWVLDREGAPRAVAGVDRDPTGPSEGTARSVRGGSFRTPDGDADGLTREALDARLARVDVGFRCARGL
jgi:formylglycine-generating enzyme required for sulfatase activity